MAEIIVVKREFDDMEIVIDDDDDDEGFDFNLNLNSMKFKCLGENSEKIHTVLIQIKHKIRFIDSVIFMLSP